MAAKKKLTPQQQRDRRSKILLAIVGVVFLGVLALQLPKFLKGSQGGGAAAAPPASATSPTTGIASPAGGVVPTQLRSFSRFSPKDPFKPRANLNSGQGTGGATGASGAGQTTAGATSSPPAASPTPTPVKKSPPPITFTVTPQKQQLKPAGPMVPAVLIRINGKKHVLALGAMFPTKAPIFQIVGLARTTVSIRLIGGSLSNGEQTLKVLRGHPVTLLNSTAGTRYVLSLVKPTTAPPPPPAPTTTAATTTAASTTSATPTTPTTTTSG